MEKATIKNDLLKIGIKRIEYWFDVGEPVFYYNITIKYGQHYTEGHQFLFTLHLAFIP